jgi:S1-C subfamily serine protease
MFGAAVAYRIRHNIINPSPTLVELGDIHARSDPAASRDLALRTISSQSAQPSQIAAGDIYKTYSPAVVLIETYGDDAKASGAGSGFIVSPDGRILTNYHVIAHTKRATVRLANNDAYDSVEVIEIDMRKDIALQCSTTQ